jgi:uncharacterized DUF497 family protein
MKYEWDENKRQTNLEKHGKNFDFAMAHKIWESDAPRVTDNAERKGEERYKTTGKMDKELCVVVWEDKENARRIISFRRPTEPERQTYEREIGRELGRDDPLLKLLERTERERDKRSSQEPLKERKERDEYER